MFGKLKDQLDHAFNQGTRRRWRDMVDTFKLKYPEVKVYDCSNVSAFPGAFIVTRSSAGEYAVKLYPNKVEVTSELTKLAKGNQYITDITPEPARWRRGYTVKEFEAASVRQGGNYVVTWGVFDYDGRFGEFTRFPYPFNESSGFIEFFVLDEDKDALRGQRNG